MESVLTDQERQVIQLRYGLGGQAPMRQREVAQITGISRSYISRIEKRALEKLRKAIEPESDCAQGDFPLRFLRINENKP